MTYLLILFLNGYPASVLGLNSQRNFIHFLLLRNIFFQPVRFFFKFIAGYNIEVLMVLTFKKTLPQLASDTCSSAFGLPF